VASVQRHALMFTGGTVVPKSVFDVVSREKNSPALTAIDLWSCILHLVPTLTEL